MLPKEEVTNYFIWRQIDCTRNSVQSVAQYYFSHNSIQKLNSKQLQNKLLMEKDVNWNDYPIPCKRGTCVVKRPTEIPVKDSDQTITRMKWFIDENIPIFTEKRSYVENCFNQPHS